jgi:hypothetical protein
MKLVQPAAAGIALNLGLEWVLPGTDSNVCR